MGNYALTESRELGTAVTDVLKTWPTLMKNICLHLYSTEGTQYVM